MSKKTTKRFIKTYSQGAMDSIEIIVDTETGINYLYRSAGYSGGLTPLLNSDGTPVVTPITKTFD